MSWQWVQCRSLDCLTSPSLRYVLLESLWPEAQGLSAELAMPKTALARQNVDLCSLHETALSLQALAPRLLAHAAGHYFPSYSK